MKIVRLFIISLLYSSSLFAQELKGVPTSQITMGDARFEQYLPLLKGKHVALVVNQTAMVGYAGKERHLVDTLKALGVDIVKIFSPEHGFRGTADAGEEVSGGTDAKTGIAIVSLYGSNRKPTSEQMKDVDVVVFDIQDVGARFFTYISTMHYVMEACAAQKIPFIVLDRPNPNGFYVDGPVLQEKFKSFVGIDPVPIVHGMTVGEYARMLNGEGWLKDSVKCDLTVIPCLNYNHDKIFHPNHKPSPNLPNITAIYLYPSLCLFEGTIVSVGRGTDVPFQVFGHPDIKSNRFTFKPEGREGAKEPPFKDKVCNGFDLSSTSESFFHNKRELDLEWLLLAYKMLKEKKDSFFTNYFDKLAGTDELREQIVKGTNEQVIRQSWLPGLVKFKRIRVKYLLYKDFNSTK